MGVLDRMFELLASEADMEWLMIDSTVIRAHQHAAGAAKKKEMLHLTYQATICRV
jgi:transposase